MVMDFVAFIERTPGRSVVYARGELDVATCARLREALDEAMSGPPKSLHIDFRGLDFMAVAGAEVLLETDGLCSALGIRVSVSVSRPASRVLEVLGLRWLAVIEENPRGRSREEARIAPVS